MHLYKTCISPDGRFAACLFSSNNPRGSYTIAIFDLKDGSKLSQFISEIEGVPITQLKIDSGSQILKIIDQDKKIFRYSFDGEFLDKEAWKSTRFDRANGYNLIREVEVELENEIGSVELKRCIDLLKLALKKGVNAYHQGIAYSMLGQIHEKEGHLEEAVTMYETALKHYPKLPLKRKLKELKDKLTFS